MAVLDLLINAFVVTRFIPFWTPIYYAVLAYIGYLVYRVALFVYNQYNLEKHVSRKNQEREKNFEAAGKFVQTVPSDIRKQIRSLAYHELKGLYTYLFMFKLITVL